MCNEETYEDPETGETLDSVTREAFYLGHREGEFQGGEVGWVCGTCETEVLTSETGVVLGVVEDTEVRS